MGRGQVNADVQLARGLDAGEDARHGLTTYAGGVRRRKVRELKDLVDVAKAAAARAASYLRGLTPAAPGDWTEKGQHDFVTDADRTAEALIAAALTAGVPGSTVVGEELSPDVTRSGEVVWIVDPLDGTTNFLHRYPQYAVSIGCAVNGALCVGVIHDIARDVAYWGARGAGAWEGDRPLRVSARTEPRPALVGTGLPFKDLRRLTRSGRPSRASSACACSTCRSIRRITARCSRSWAAPTRPPRPPSARCAWPPSAST